MPTWQSGGHLSPPLRCDVSTRRLDQDRREQASCLADSRHPRGGDKTRQSFFQLFDSSCSYVAHSSLTTTTVFSSHPDSTRYCFPSLSNNLSSTTLLLLARSESLGVSARQPTALLSGWSVALIFEVHAVSHPTAVLSQLSNIRRYASRPGWLLCVARGMLRAIGSLCCAVLRGAALSRTERQLGLLT